MISYEELCEALERHKAAQLAAEPPMEELPAEAYAVDAEAPYASEEGAEQIDPLSGLDEELMEEGGGEQPYGDAVVDAEQPEYAAEQPEYAAEQPEYAAEQPEDAAEQPEDAAEQPPPYAEDPAAEDAEQAAVGDSASEVLLAGPSTEPAPSDVPGAEVEGAEGEDPEKSPA